MKRCTTLILATLAFTIPAHAEPIVGRASVIDGDTLEIRGTRIRLQGVDAPESAQLCQDRAGKDYRCGQKAALALADWIGTANVSCEPQDKDRYGRTVAVCSKGGADLNAWLAENGHALAYREYSKAYVDEEAAASSAKVGIWAGTFTKPWDWRKEKRGGSASAPAKPTRASDATGATGAGCTIKGNINGKGERIYHTASSRMYARTQAEQMFCSEEQARAAGFRAPRG